VGAPGNRAYDRLPARLAAGRGRVDYEYRIGRFEVTTGQWMEFLNTFKARADPVRDAWLDRPITWGAVRDRSYTGPGVRYRLRDDLPEAGMVPLSGINWRMAARYCNWLHNDKVTSHAAIESGAYDASTFFSPTSTTWLDQRERSPGARYFIPTWDEWLKASHYDPNRVNDDGSVGGWWLQPHGTDMPLVYGPPASMGGTGQANAGFILPGFGESYIPLGSYSDVRSPWGLLDVAGAADEWTESVYRVNDIDYRMIDGSSSGGSAGGLDYVYGAGARLPPELGFTSFRIASIPSPATLSVLVGLVVLRGRCR
jgi:formylglycine-generating enzyme